MVFNERESNKIMQLFETRALTFNRQLTLNGLTSGNLEKIKNAKPDGIIIIGMGGSGLPANILAGLSRNIGCEVPIFIWKSYGLPDTNFKKPLYVFISFSGNTAETISGLTSLLKKRRPAKIGIVSTGGVLKKLAQKYKLAYVTFSAKNLTPREGLGYTFYSLVKLLKTTFPNLLLQNLNQKINPRRFKKEALSLAKFINKTITLVYTDSIHTYLGYIWKTNLNETAKQPVFTNTLPEMNHNEITVFEKKSFPFSALFLENQKTEKNLIQKMRLTEKLLKSSGVKTKTVKPIGKSEEEIAWNSIILSNLVSIYLAKIRKVDPSETRLIDQLKMIKNQ